MRTGLMSFGIVELPIVRQSPQRNLTSVARPGAAGKADQPGVLCKLANMKKKNTAK